MVEAGGGHGGVGDGNFAGVDGVDGWVVGGGGGGGAVVVRGLEELEEGGAEHGVVFLAGGRSFLRLREQFGRDEKLDVLEGATYALEEPEAHD